MLTTLATLIALTVPQRKALGLHLIAYVRACIQYEGKAPALTEDQARGIASRVLEGGKIPTEQDLNVLYSAVYLAPARTWISARDLATLKRAWQTMGWTGEWDNEEEKSEALALAAESAIRAILNPPPAQLPAVDSIWVVIKTGTWIKVVDTGTGSIQWAAVDPIGDRGQTMAGTWEQNVAEGVIAPLFRVAFGDRDTIRHTPCGVHPGTCKGCNADSKTWGTPVPIIPEPGTEATALEQVLDHIREQTRGLDLSAVQILGVQVVNRPTDPGPVAGRDYIPGQSWCLGGSLAVRAKIGEQILCQDCGEMVDVVSSNSEPPFALTVPHRMPLDPAFQPRAFHAGIYPVDVDERLGGFIGPVDQNDPPRRIMTPVQNLVLSTWFEAQPLDVRDRVLEELQDRTPDPGFAGRFVERLGRSVLARAQAPEAAPTPQGTREGDQDLGWTEPKDPED